MNWGANGILILLLIFFFGCTQYYSAGKNCEGDAECFNNAVQSNCQNAFGSSSVNFDGNTETFEVSLSNNNKSCIATWTDRLNGNKIQTVTAEFVLPITKCESNFGGYHTSGFMTKNGLELNGQPVSATRKCIHFTTTFAGISIGAA